MRTDAACTREFARRAAAGKLAATLVTYPYLLVKSKVHVGEPGSIWRIFFFFWRMEGPRGFYRGMRSKLAASLLNIVVLFVVKADIVRLAHKLAGTRSTDGA